MKKMLAIMLLAMVVISGVAFADTVSGKIASTDTTANTLSVTVKDAATGAESESTIYVNAETQYATVASLAELKQGDEVSVEVKKDEATGNWWATSIKVGAEEAAAAPAEAAPAAEAPAAQ